MKLICVTFYKVKTFLYHWNNFRIVESPLQHLIENNSRERIDYSRALGWLLQEIRNIVQNKVELEVKGFYWTFSGWRFDQKTKSKKKFGKMYVVFVRVQVCYLFRVNFPI